MTVLAIEIHDAGLIVHGLPGDAADGILPSPGYALLDGKNLLTGREAAAGARRNPKRVNNRFWCELDTAPLSRPFPGELSHADLAHAHLTALWDEVQEAAQEEVQDVLLVVPGSYSEEQLGLLLGIARACEIPVRGLIDAAVAAAVASPASSSGRVLHVDMELHRTVLTELVVESGELVRVNVESSPNVGLERLQEAWLRKVGEIFVRETRFDPLHAATSEQDLVRRMPGVLEELCGKESVTLKFTTGGVTVTADLPADEMARAVEQEYRTTAGNVARRSGDGVTILLSHRAAGLPGLGAALSGFAEARWRALPPGAAGRSALQFCSRIRSEEEALPFVIRLPVAGKPQGPEEAEARATGEEGHTAPTPSTGIEPASRDRPTHIVLSGRAVPLQGPEVSIGTRPPEGKPSLKVQGDGIEPVHCRLISADGRVRVETVTGETLLNGKRVGGRAVVVAGDRLRLGRSAMELLLIQVSAE